MPHSMAGLLLFKEFQMAKFRRVKTVTRVQKKGKFGMIYYPRLEISGQELEVAGFSVGTEYEVIIDLDESVITIRPLTKGEQHDEP